MEAGLTQRIPKLIFGFTFVLLSQTHAFPLCFDFSRKVTEPLRTAIPLKPGEDHIQFGQLPSGAFWGAARGVIQKSVPEVLKLLLDNNLTRNVKTTVISVTKKDGPHYLELHHVKVNVRPFPFISLKWEEDWAYALVDGKREDPNTIVISYQKTSGEERLELLCGSMVIKKALTRSSDLYLYEEVKAPRRTAEETAEGHLGTLRTLRRAQPSSTP